MSNGCSQKDADLSCLDRPKYKLLRYHKFLRERGYSVKEFFLAIEINVNGHGIGKSDLEIYSDTDPEELRMNAEVHFDFNGEKSIIKITELMEFVNLLAFTSDV